MRDLVDTHYPKVERIRLVLDNLSTHTPAALYETFYPAEARRILRRLEFHYTPKHASWLNMVEIEIGVMVAQCLDRRIPSKEKWVSEIKAWERRRNREKTKNKWLFTVEPAREKLGRAYPTPCSLPDSCSRHSCAVALLQAGVDVTVIRDYLGQRASRRRAGTSVRM
jgi:hypothetical protein